MHVVFFLDCISFVFGSEHELVGKFDCHRLSFASAGAVNNPAECERETARLRNFARHLVVCTTDAAGTDLHQRSDVANCGIKNLERIRAGCLHFFEGVIHNLAGSVFLSVPHDGIDETGESLRTVLEVGTPGADFFKRSTHRKLFWFLGSVTRATLAALLKTCRVEFAAHDGVLHTDVFHATATKKHHRVFLEVMAFAGNVGSDFHAVGEAHTGDLADSRVRFARGFGSHLGAHATLKGRWIVGRTILEGVEATRKSQDFRLAAFVLATLLRELIDGSHLEKEDPRWVKSTIPREILVCKYCCVLKVLSHGVYINVRRNTQENASATSCTGASP